MYNAASVLIAGVFGFVSLRWATRHELGLFLLPFFLGVLFETVSLLYLENSALYLIELDAVSGPNGATLSYLGYQICFTLGLALSLRRTPQRVPPPWAGTRPWMGMTYRGSAGFVVALLALLYLHLFLSAGIPLLDPYISKVRFWNEYARVPQLRSIVGTTSAYIPFVIGVSWQIAGREGRARRRRRAISALLFVAYLGYVALLGHKFGAFYFSLWYVFLPTAYARLRSGEVLLRPREIMAFAASGAAILAFVVFQYTSHPIVAAVESPLRLLLYRVGIQSQLWWRVHSHVFQGEGDAFGQLLHLQDGLHFLMRRFASGFIDVEAAIEEGTNFSSGNPAIGLLVWGPALLVVHQLATGALWGWVIRVFRWQLDHGGVLEVIIGLQLYAWLQYALSMGNYNMFFNGRDVVLGLFLALTYALRTASGAPLVPNRDVSTA